MITIPFDLSAELAILESRLKWPDPATMRAYYIKLLNNPDSVVLLALESPEGPDGPRWKMVWFSSRERNALRKAITKVNAARAKKNQQLTNELPSE